MMVKTIWCIVRHNTLYICVDGFLMKTTGLQIGFAHTVGRSLSFRGAKFIFLDLIYFFPLIAFNQTAKLTTATIKIIHVALRNVQKKKERKKEGENCRVTHGRLGELSEDPTSPAPTESTEYGPFTPPNPSNCPLLPVVPRWPSVFCTELQLQVVITD